MSELRAGREVPEMVEASVEVRIGTARFRAAVQAESTKRALGLVASRYPASTCRAKVPMEAEVFSYEGFDARAGMVELLEKLAA